MASRNGSWMSIDWQVIEGDEAQSDEEVQESPRRQQLRRTLSRRSKEQLAVLAATSSRDNLSGSVNNAPDALENVHGRANSTNVLTEEPASKKPRTDTSHPLPMQGENAASTSRPGPAPRVPSAENGEQKKRGRKSSKPLEPPYRMKDFSKRFPTVASYAKYLAGPKDDIHIVAYHPDAPLKGVRALFLTKEKCLSKSLALNMDNLTRLGGVVHEAFISAFTPPKHDTPTTHIIVAGTSELKFPQILKLLKLEQEHDLVGPLVAAGEPSAQRDVWVIKISWLHECCRAADSAKGVARKLSEMAHLVECEGDKKRRKSFFLKQKSLVSIVADLPADEFRMPVESQASTQEQIRRDQEPTPSQASGPAARWPAFMNESPLSFEDMAFEIDMARKNLDIWIEQDDNDTVSQNGDMTSLGDRSEPFVLPSLRADPVDSDECPSDQEDAYKDAKEKEKLAVTREARKNKQALGERYRCDASSKMGAGRDGPNEAVASTFDQLAAYYEKSKLPNAFWRVKGYRTAAGALRNVGRKIETYEDAVQLPGIGSKTATKLLEIVQTGKSTQLEHKTTEDKIADIFTKIYGVGPSIALSWYHAGMRTLDDVANSDKFGVTLTPSMQLGLKYYADLNERMPRAEVSQHYDKIKRAAFAVDPHLRTECMGSFRRGQADCGDIDIIVTRDTGDGKDHSGMVQRLVETLFAQGVIKHTLSNPDDWRSLDAKWMGLLAGPNGKMRRIDILGVPYDELGAALIYFTGNDIFNRSLRLKARHMGFSLNQRGLFKDVFRDRKTGEKKTCGQRVASRTEEEIFVMLGTKWRPPEERLP